MGIPWGAVDRAVTGRDLGFQGPFALASVLGTDFRGKGRDEETNEKILEPHMEVIQLGGKGAQPRG